MRHHCAMKEQPEPMAPGAILRDDDHHMFVYLGEFKGQAMAAPLYRRDKQTLAGDVLLTNGVVARVSAIAPVTDAVPTGQTVDERQLALCMQALEHLADTESLITRLVAKDTEGALFSWSAFQNPVADEGSAQPPARGGSKGKL